jgi:hypothetical protein
MKPRYKLDIRIRCIAIVDSFHPFESNGLSADNPNIVRFAYINNGCETLHKLKQDELAAKCEELNNNNVVTEIMATKAIRDAREANRLLNLFFTELDSGVNIKHFI